MTRPKRSIRSVWQGAVKAPSLVENREGIERYLTHIPPKPPRAQHEFWSEALIMDGSDVQYGGSYFAGSIAVAVGLAWQLQDPEHAMAKAKAAPSDWQHCLMRVTGGKN